MTDTETRSTFSRRRLLGILGAGAAGAVPAVSLLGRASVADAKVAVADVSCARSDTAEQEVGPFYVAEGIVRSDITSGEDGVPLTFTITLTIPDTCEPLVGAAVDVWHASAAGIYSDESSEQTVGETFLRGIQISDSAGQVTFTSIFPGWYSGRTNHIHARIYTGGSVSGSSYDYSDATLVHTGQLFFGPDVNTAVAAVSPYTSNTVTRTTNAEDRVYTTQSGAAVLTDTTGDTTDGYTSTVTYDITAASTSKSTDSTTLTLTRSREALVYGHDVTLAGVLTDTTTSSVLSGQRVVLSTTSPSGTTKKTTLTTDDDGAWSLVVHPAATASYRASYAATGSDQAASSGAKSVTVHRRVTVSHVSSTADASEPVVIRGRVTPAGKKLLVRLYLLTSNGERAQSHVITDSEGHWTADLHLSKGRHRVCAHVPAAGALAAGTSRTLTVRRT